MPPPGVGYVPTATSHDDVRPSNGLYGRLGQQLAVVVLVALPGHPFGQLRSNHLPELLRREASPSREYLHKLKIGKSSLDGHRTRAILLEALRGVRNDPYLRARPLLIQARRAALQHGDVAEIQQVVSGLVNENSHWCEPTLHARVR